MFGDFKGVNQQDTIDAAVRQRYCRRIDQRRGGPARGGPVHHPLLRRHEGENADRLRTIDLEVGRGIADAKDRKAVAALEALADQATDKSPRHLAKRRCIERAKIDDIESHAYVLHV